MFVAACLLQESRDLEFMALRGPVVAKLLSPGSLHCSGSISEKHTSILFEGVPKGSAVCPLPGGSALCGPVLVALL